MTRLGSATSTGTRSSIGIATPHYSATDAAVQVVRDGGSVVDAAIAAAITLSVVYPHNCGVGGDLIALHRTAGGRVRCVNASGPAARATDADQVRRRHGASMPVSGVDTVTVPGAVAGWWRLHQLGGRLPWARLFDPAVELAGDGTPVSRSVSSALADAASSNAVDAGWRQVFIPSGTVPREGELLRQPALAQTLGRLAEHGPAALYEGPVGEQLVAYLAGYGGALRMSDLGAYLVDECEPLVRPVADWQVWTAPPNSQGFALLQVLAGLQRAGHRWEQSQPVDPALLAGLFRAAAEDRDTLLADPRHAPVDVAALLEPPADPTESDAAPAGASAPADDLRPNGDTVAICVGAQDGAAISLIQSLFYSFGSGICDPATGIVAHNRGAFFSLDPASPNVLAAGKRPAHTLMPVLVTHEDRLRFVAGTRGGTAQFQILTQVLLAALAGAPAAASVGAPRWVLGGTGVAEPRDVVLVEAPTPGITKQRFADAGWQQVELAGHSEETGHAHLVALHAGGLDAAADPRSDGSAVVLDS